MAGKKESLFSRKDGDGKKPEPMRNVEHPKAEGGEKPTPSNKGGDNGKGAQPHADIGKRHHEERTAMHETHEKERRDLHMNHREEHRRMHGRHETAHKEMMQRQESEMQAAAPAMPDGAGPEMGTAGPAAAGTDAPTGAAA